MLHPLVTAMALAASATVARHGPANPPHQPISGQRLHRPIDELGVTALQLGHLRLGKGGVAGHGLSR